MKTLCLLIVTLVLIVGCKKSSEGDSEYNSLMTAPNPIPTTMDLCSDSRIPDGDTVWFDTLTPYHKSAAHPYHHKAVWFSYIILDTTIENDNYFFHCSRNSNFTDTLRINVGEDGLLFSNTKTIKGMNKVFANMQAVKVGVHYAYNNKPIYWRIHNARLNATSPTAHFYLMWR